MPEHDESHEGGTQTSRRNDSKCGKLCATFDVLTPTIVEMNSLRTADTGPA